MHPCPFLLFLESRGGRRIRGRRPAGVYVRGAGGVDFIELRFFVVETRLNVNPDGCTHIRDFGCRHGAEHTVSKLPVGTVHPSGITDHITGGINLFL